MNLRGLLQKMARDRAAATPMTNGDASVIRPMPRRKTSHSIGSAHVTLPMARRVTFKPGVIRPITRLCVWLWSLIRFYSGNFVDVVMRRDRVERRAIRLRQVFEDGGPTFAKLGQQISMRADMLPYVYCAELGEDARPGPSLSGQASHRYHRADQPGSRCPTFSRSSIRSRSDRHHWPACTRRNCGPVSTSR